MMNLDALFKNLLTGGIGLSDPATVRKVKLFNLFQLAVAMGAPLLGLFYFYVGAITLFYVALLTGLLSLSSLLLLRKTKNLVLAGNWAITVLWTALFVIAWHTGAINYEGVMNPCWLLNGALILLAIFLLGYFWGALWATIIFVETGIVVYLYSVRYPFPNLIPYDMAAVYHLGTFLVGLLLVLFFAFMFEREREDALLREKGKSQALRDSKKYIDDILERSPVPTFVLDRGHRVVQWNPACQEVSGVLAGEIVGKAVWEGFRIDEKGSLADRVIEAPESIGKDYGDSVVSKTESGWYELELFLPRLKEGKRAVIKAAQILDDRGILKGAIQTVQEVTKPALEKAIVESDSRGPLNEAFISPVYKVDAEGTITFWSHACEESFGYTASEMVGKPVFELLSSRHRPLLRETIEKALKGEALVPRMWKYVHREGRILYALAKAYGTEADDGKGGECLIVNTDVTTLRMRQKKLEMDAAESKEKLKNLTEEYDLLRRNIATFIRGKENKKDAGEKG
jgi:PAS domain S-box-containing protein